MPYWKVVKSFGKVGGTSVLVRSMALVTYPRGEYAGAPEWLAKKGYHPTIFTDLQAAKSFKSPEDALWECGVIGLIDELPPCLSPYLVSEGCTDRTYPTNFPWPPDTAMAKQVMLTRRIE